ncbi:lipoprotein N-acyltransferase Lnb domain-containing protein [Maribellus luteus]|nr:DUF4105 domain-containing protein [Maribellus luteus]
MKIHWLPLLFLSLFLSVNFKGKAFELSSCAEISVITCSPGNESYSVYGHSAIRVKDLSLNYDMVFNYGIFDFNSSNFLYRFAKGETDYLLGVYPFVNFMEEYIEKQRSVYEQVLNLQQNEKQKMLNFLLWNARTENRIYRYDFFFDNCATRVRDVIANNVEGGIEYFDETPEKTFRDLIKEYQKQFLWLDFGIDFLVGADADRKATLEEEMFLPEYIMAHFAEARRRNGELLVMRANVIFSAGDNTVKNKWITPLGVFGMLLLWILGLTIMQCRKRKSGGVVDIVVYGLSGIAGLLIGWFVLYSEHPAMSPNYNLLWLVPLNLIFAFAWLKIKWRPVLKYYHLLVSVWLAAFVVLSNFLPQKFHLVFYILIAIILTRSLSHSLQILKERKG